MVQFKNVTKIYDKKIVAVNEVSFQLSDGEFVFLIGPSGSGKSTLIKMLVRDEVPSIGSVYFNDRDITRVSRSKVYKLRREIGVIFQDFKLIQDKTAYENIAFAMEVAGKKAHEIKETVPYVLDIVGLSTRMSAFPRQLSGGEQQRVAIARALSNNPKLLIADEPTGNLDPGSAWDIIQILTKINQWGTTVIMSTHGTDIVNSLGKRVIQMDKGRIIRDDDKGKYEMTKEYEASMNEVAHQSEKKQKGPIKISIKSGKMKSQKEKESMSLKKELEQDKVAEELDEDTQVNQTENKKSFLFNPFAKKKRTQAVGSENKIEEKEDTHTHLHLDLNHTDDGSEEENTDHSVEGKSETVEEPVKNEYEVAESKRKEKKLQHAKTFADLVATEKQKTNNTGTPIKELGLPSKIYKALKKSGFATVEEIIESGPEGLEQIIDLTPENIILIAKKITKFNEELS